MVPGEAPARLAGCGACGVLGPIQVGPEFWQDLLDEIEWQAIQATMLRNLRSRGGRPRKPPPNRC
jgi:hypothetical protein